MILIVCLDNKNGMIFNHRRQSQDRIVRQRIAQMTAQNPVYMNAYSKELYKEISDVVVCEDFLEQAKKGNYCLIENRQVKDFEDKIEGMIIFRWNKVYPADMIFDIDLSRWKLVQTEEFEGSSHQITMEVYEGEEGK